MKKSIVLMSLLLCAFAVSALAQGAPGEQKGKGGVWIHAARVIDGSGREPIKDGVVYVVDDKIRSIGTTSNMSIPKEARVIELGDATLMPGFIDAHTHIIGRVVGDPAGDDAPVRDTDSFGAILAVENAKRTLMAGFTTIRNLGAPNFDDIALKKAINEGWIVGPRMIAAAHSFGITGGHCDENGYKPGLQDSDYRNGVADGVDEVRKAVRYQVKYGADAIKICATGGVLSEGDAVGATQYTLEEMKAVVAEASKLERKVAAHSHGAEGIKLAVQAGVSSIEHGSFLDAEAAKMMAEKGTFLVPTLMAGEGVERLAKNGVLKGLRGEKALAAAAAMRNGIKTAKQYGVPIALGTDAGVIPHGTNAHEFTLMVEWGGLKPMEAIVAGTLNAARLLGIDEKTGSIDIGKAADLVAVAGDPTKDIKAMEKTKFVMKSGFVYKEQK